MGRGASGRGIGISRINGNNDVDLAQFDVEAMSDSELRYYYENSGALLRRFTFEDVTASEARNYIIREMRKRAIPF